MNQFKNGWQEEMTIDEQKNLAYWERNMLALYLADCYPLSSGWYRDEQYQGWSRVISINIGAITFHVPDEFDMGNLKQIKPNWDGHTTTEKWERIMNACGVRYER